MKKTVVIAASSAAGFAVVIGAHAASGGPHALAGPKAAPPTASKAGGSPGQTSSSSGQSAGSQATTTTAPATTSPPAGRVASAVGTSEQYGYGVLAVKVTMDGGRITDVSLARLQTAESYSQMIAQQAVPILRQEVLQAQGVQVNGVSGATYTTEAYLLSVQSALNKLRP